MAISMEKKTHDQVWYPVLRQTHLDNHVISCYIMLYHVISCYIMFMMSLDGKVFFKREELAAPAGPCRSPEVDEELSHV